MSHLASPCSTWGHPSASPRRTESCYASSTPTLGRVISVLWARAMLSCHIARHGPRRQGSLGLLPLSDGRRALAAVTVSASSLIRPEPCHRPPATTPCRLRTNRPPGLRMPGTHRARLFPRQACGRPYQPHAPIGRAKRGDRSSEPRPLRPRVLGSSLRATLSVSVPRRRRRYQIMPIDIAHRPPGHGRWTPFRGNGLRCSAGLFRFASQGASPGYALASLISYRGVSILAMLPSRQPGQCWSVS